MSAPNVSSSVLTSTVWGYQRNTEVCVYGIGLLPLGGYCKLTGQSDDPREQKRNASKGYKDYDYNAKPLWARALIISAGVIMNMIFGFLLLMYGYMQGVPTSPAVAGIVIDNTPAANADIRSGDEILEINGEPMPDFGKVKETFVMNPGEEFVVKLRRNGQIIERRVMGNQGPDGLNQIGLMPAINTTISLDSTEQPFPGKEYSTPLQDKDRIIAINGEPISPELTGGYKVYQEIEKNPGKDVQLTLQRGSETIDLTLPVLGTGSYDFGYRVAIGVRDVVAGSPAEKSGLKSGDIITSIQVNNQDYPIISSASFIDAVTSQAFLPVEVEYLSNGERLTTTIKPVFMSWDTTISSSEDSFLGVGVNGTRVTTILNTNPHSILVTKLLLLTAKMSNHSRV